MPVRDEGESVVLSLWVEDSAISLEEEGTIEGLGPWVVDSKVDEKPGVIVVLRS